MLKYIQNNRQYANILTLWFVSGSIFSPALYVLVPASIFFFRGRNRNLMLFLGFWFILILSDARGGFESAPLIKIVYLLILFWFYITNTRLRSLDNKYKNFLPFTFAASISLVFSPILFESFQKTLSYLLILLIVPAFSTYLIYSQKKAFLKGLVYTGALVLSVGLLLWPVWPDFVVYAERFSGFFGNPNGLGIFCILYSMLWLIIKFYYPQWFGKRNRWFINALILASVFFAASRGALLAVSMFYILDYSVRRQNPLIILGVVLVFISFFFSDNIIKWLYSMGVGEYLRAQTLEGGSGRIVAFEYAWDEIKNNPLFGKGFNYDIYWFVLVEENRIELSFMGHEGGTHNSYLSVLMNTGFLGLFAFLIAWGSLFAKAMHKSPFGFPVLLIVLFSTNIEAWLSGSLNPFTIILIIILTLLTDRNFLKTQNS